jgi:hypothetical protein
LIGKPLIQRILRPGGLLSQAVVLAILVVLVQIFLIEPKRRRWIDIPAYPGIAQVISRDEQATIHRVEFTTAAGVSETLAWYDATFTANGWTSIEPAGADRRYRYIRISPCTVFYVELRLGESGHLIETDTLDLPRDCHRGQP